MATDDIHSLTGRSVHAQLGDSDHVPAIIIISTEGCPTHSKRLNWNLKQAVQSRYRHPDQRNGHINHCVRLQQGVPQGGVITTTLFLVFIDEIADGLSRHIPRSLHADDLAIWNAEDNLPTATYRMQVALNTVACWALN
ncbi:hypothetical protein ElyMa_000723900 [Elysia marginata]|uniref:Reverse transcriptase domain-containing protein n=1 Tax=Elysia marginata TaxID=1093978 RepID=A0AAV4GNM3_9GAST|nr:hypothetical protein ElyMa_000723900 [Elysia marginata]